MKLRTIDIIILVLLGLLFIARATWGIFKDIHIDISAANSVTGKVIQAETIQVKETTFKLNKYKTVFTIKLENSNLNLAVDRGADFCNNLATQIQKGDSVKILYRLSTSEYNSFIFQIEKNKKVLANFNDYKKRETGMIILAYVFGFLILAGLTFWYINKKKRNSLAPPGI